MAASPQIIINVAGESAGTPGVARTFTYAKINGVSPVVTLSIASTTGVTSYYWEIISKPVGSSATLSDPTSATPTFSATSTFAGTYLIRVTINAGASSGTNGLAFLTEFAGLRKLSHQETLEFGSAGWTTAVNAIIDSVDAGVIGSSVPISYTYNDATDRLAATGFDSGDVGKWARQLDDGSVWILDDDSPITWGAISPDNNAPSALIPCLVSPRTITNADHGKTLIAAAFVIGGFQFVLPATATAGVTVTLTTLANAGLDARVTADATGTIVGSGSLSGAGVSEVKAGAEGASITLKYLGGPSKQWVVTDGLGYWDVSLLGVPTGDCFTFTPAIPGATTGGIVVFDSDGQISDSTVDVATVVIGPAAATDHGIARYELATGKLIQDSLATVDDAGSIDIPGGQSYKINNVALAAADVGAEVPITFSDSLNRAVNTVTLDNDSASPGNLYYYGTNSAGTKGWHLLPVSEGGGSDMTIYSNIAGDFQVTFKDGDELNVFGLPASISAVQIKRITRKPTGAAVSVIKNRGTDLVCTWTPDVAIPLAGVIATTSLGTLLASDEYIIEIDGPPKGYNAATDSAKAMVTNALHYCNDGVIADLTTDTIEVVKPLLADGYNAFSLTAVLGAAGDDVVVLGSNDPLGVSDYYDITALALGVPQVTVSGAYQTAEPLMFQYVKIYIDGTTSAKVYLTRFRK